MDLTQIVADQVEEKIEAPDLDTADDVLDETPELDTPAASTSDATDTPASTEVPSAEVQSPAAKALEASEAKDKPADPSAGEDDFNKRFGLPAGKNNPIPYHRVRKIMEKNERDVTTKVTKQLEDTYKPKLAEYETKLKGYDEQLQNVANFEQVMLNDQEKFLNWLSEVPAYKGFFEYVGNLVNFYEQSARQQAGQQAAEADPRPQPKQQADGTYGYDEEGLAALEAWQRRQIEGKVNERIKPIEQKFQQEEQQRKAEQARQHHVKTVIEPQIASQLQDARANWPNFTELEGEIEKALLADPKLNLERAYMKAYQSVVVPKMQTDAASLRAKLLEEIKTAPPTTAVLGKQSKPQHAPTSFSSMEELVAAQVQSKLGNS